MLQTHSREMILPVLKMNEHELLQEVHGQIRHLIDDLTVAVDDEGHVLYAPRPGLVFSNLIGALIPLAAQIKLSLEAGPAASPLLVRDLAEIAGTDVHSVCAALVELGHSPRSTNMAVTPDEAVAVAKRLIST